MKIKRKSLQRIKKWLTILLSLGVLSLILWGYWKSNLFTITTYSLVGVEDRYREPLTKALNEHAQGYTYFVIPNNKVLSYSTDHINESIVQIIPDVKSIDLRPVGLHTLRVTISEHQPLFKFRDTVGVTEDGVLFNTNKDLRVYPLLVIASSTKKDITFGELSFKQLEGVDKNFLVGLSEFEKNISSIIFPVDHITLDEEGDIALYDTRGISKVMITRTNDPKKAWSTLVSAIDTDPLKTKLATERDLLLYLDIRFGNKVFYKFSNTPFQNSKDSVTIEGYEEPPLTTPPVLE